ncbi:hypothetical protein N7493_003342 [Penicillium malachiteum]|uniref:Nephrocystin 3-like N-terminal domain-containing protein n=1 Tax=Penicillium malachiteum TaxID=1324776 RepID=A0AAD6HQ48_9EURO|nr:hypothetical protein N7493_003342 [Penicillium malachiteum]
MIVQNTLNRRDAIFSASEYLAETLAYYALIDANYRDRGVGSDHNLDQALLQVYSAILAFTVEVKKAQNESAGSDRKVAAAHLAKIKNVEPKILSAEEERQLDWMSRASYSSRQRDLQKKRTEGTGDWLLVLDQYTYWKSNAGGLLWLPGISGCGKSVLCSTVIHDIKRDCESDDSKYIAYWYFEFNDEKSQNGDIMTRSLIRQLSRSPLLPSVIKIWENHHLRGSDPDSQTVSDLLDDVISNIPGHVYLVLDALDECPENAKSKERATILSLLTGLIKRHKNKLHILATSCPEQDIKFQLEGFSTIDVGVHLDNDVRSFAETSIVKGELKKFKQDLKDLIKGKLLSSKERRFRWAELQIAELEDCYTDRDFIDVLNSILHTLEETYRKILDGFRSRNIRLVRGILILICLSPNVLDLETVAAMVGLDSPDAVLKICTTALVNEVDGKIRVDEAAFFKYAATYWNTHVTASMDADRAPDFQAKIDRLFTEPNVYFNWVRMMDSKCPHWDDSRINRIENCEQPIQIASWMGLYQNVEHLLNQGTSPNAFGSRSPHGYALQIASYAGHENIVELPLDRGAKVNGRLITSATFTAGPTALIRATESGHESIVRLLLERGADVSPTMQKHGSALQIASYHGDEKIVEMLLDHNADINASRRGSDSAVYTASLHGYEKICKILLDQVAICISEQDLVAIFTMVLVPYMLAGDGRSALQDAAEGNNNGIFQLLLDRGTDINSNRGTSGNALYHLAYNGHASGVQMMLDRGADVHLPGGLYGSALQLAACRGYEEITQMLLDRGADVNANNGWSSALHKAAYNGHISIVQILLDWGADINILDDFYGTTLQAAAVQGYEDIMQMMLDRGVDVNANSGRNGTALHTAVRNGHTSAVQMLLDWGAYVNAPEEEYSSPLQVASSDGNEKMVRMLLNHGADPNSQSGELKNALYEAASRGYVEIVQILLASGADVNARDSEGLNALHGAAWEGYKEVVQILLDEGADVNTEASVSALSFVCDLSNECTDIIGIVQMLLDRGADVNFQGENGTPLQLASSAGNEKIVEILLDHGADINVQGVKEGETAIQVALANGHERIVQMLRERGAKLDAQEGFQHLQDSGEN